MPIIGKNPDNYKMQADATLTQANPVSGTKYTVLAATRNVRIIGIEAHVTCTVQPASLEVHVTIDGIAFTWAIATPTTTTKYYAHSAVSAAETSQPLLTTDYGLYRTFIWEGRSVKVEVETTDGTVQEIFGRVRYAKIP